MQVDNLWVGSFPKWCAQNIAIIGYENLQLENIPTPTWKTSVKEAFFNSVAAGQATLTRIVELRCALCSSLTHFRILIFTSAVMIYRKLTPVES